MESISPSDLALELLNQCLRGNDPEPDLLDELIDVALSEDPRQAAEATRALFTIIVERLADLFDPALCDAYVHLFAQVIERVHRELRASTLIERYGRVRQPHRFRGVEPRRVIVLSRVTLGADVAVTSVLLDAAMRRFPGADIFLAGARKAWEMFEGSGRVGHVPVDYGRGATLRERLAVWPEMRRVLSAADTLVIDPDSRLTQLGLLPVCDEDRYYFFESRAYGGYEGEPLSKLAALWAAETFGVDDARAWLSPGAAPKDTLGCITVSLGVGENQAKRIPDPFEQKLMRMLSNRGERLLVDKGAGGDEAARVERAIAGLPGVETWQGSFAPFAAAIARSKLYFGYDSAGQHVAAAAGTPLVSVFAGYVSPRMFARWQPYGTGRAEVVRASNTDPDKVLALVSDALDRLGLS